MIPTLSFPARLPLALWLLALLSAVSVGAAPAPVILAVDTSRSLDSAALGETVDRLRLVLEALDDETPTALLAFDDEPRWLAGPEATPDETAAALRQLTLQGNYTLLNDALFVATRELERGGVLLLATDGRDENSAVEVEDIARRCEAQGVRIVSVGTGVNIEEKALRRLALVSEGDYLGPVREVDASTVADGVRAAQKAVGETARSARPSAPSRPVDGAPAPSTGAAPAGSPTSEPSSPGSSSAGSQVSEPPSEGSPWWVSPVVWGLGALVLVLLAMAALRRRGEAPVEEEDDDLDDSEERASDEAEAGLIRLELAQAEIAQEEEAPEVTVDTAVFQRMTLDERLDRTRVLSNHSVLVMRKLGERPRTFMLDRQKAFGVGRDRLKNTLAVPDPALSSRHFKIVPRDDLYYFVDLESTNGSYVNGRRVGAKRLRHGDMIRAGQVEFEYQNYSNI